MPTDLARLKSQRDALTAEIKLIEEGIKKATYDACMQEQYLTFNEHRLREGKRQLSASEYEAGIFMDEPEASPKPEIAMSERRHSRKDE
jgi:hypothetical protein